MNIDIKFNFKPTTNLIKKVTSAMSTPNRLAVHQKAAEVVRGRMIRQTPKRWTGQTRRSWVIQRTGGDGVVLTNTSKVMKFLEDGTRAHGPKRAKRLFVPLTKRAFLAGPRGVISANKAAAAQSQWSNYGSAAAGKKTKKKKLPFVVGVDFVFAKRVRGIRAMNIVKNARSFANTTCRMLMVQHLVKTLRGAL
jgi:hypothetical protein